MDALWKAIEMEKAKANDPRLSKIERAETLRVRANAAASLGMRCWPTLRITIMLTATLTLLHPLTYKMSLVMHCAILQNTRL